MISSRSVINKAMCRRRVIRIENYIDPTVDKSVSYPSPPTFLFLKSWHIRLFFLLSSSERTESVSLASTFFLSFFRGYKSIKRHRRPISSVTARTRLNANKQQQSGEIDRELKSEELCSYHYYFCPDSIWKKKKKTFGHLRVGVQQLEKGAGRYCGSACISK